MTSSLLTPVLALVCWTLIMWVWLYVTRIPAMKAADIDLTKKAEAKEKMESLPETATNVADNYNHLHEQPVIFYALVLYVHLAGTGTEIDALLAWGYVGFRIIHSLIQCTKNVIMHRFYVFVLASACLFALAARALMAL